MNANDLAGLQDRVARARTRLGAVPETGAGELGPPDPETGERWNRLHVLGHMAEFLPFWTGEVRKALGGAGWIGRGEGGDVNRAAAIDSGPASEERDLRARAQAGIDGLLALLAEAGSSDLSREVEFRVTGGTSSRSIRRVLEGTLVGHLEGHVQQLEELTPGTVTAE